jgi:hypothetical protein
VCGLSSQPRRSDPLLSLQSSCDSARLQPRTPPPHPACLPALSPQFTRKELAEAARQCELYIGTMGGGMDQAISCLAEVGKAQHIQVRPRPARARKGANTRKGAYTGVGWGGLGWGGVGGWVGGCTSLSLPSVCVLLWMGRSAETLR